MLHLPDLQSEGGELYRCKLQARNDLIPHCLCINLGGSVGVFCIQQLRNVFRANKLLMLAFLTGPAYFW